MIVNWTGNPDIDRQSYVVTPGKVLICVPVLRSVTEPAFYSFLGIAEQGYDFGRVVPGDPSTVRNRMAQLLLSRPEYTHLLMLDDDHIHPPALPSRLLQWWQQDQSRLVIAAVVHRRCHPFDPLASVRDGQGNFQALARVPKLLFRAARAATSAMLVHRSVFELVPPPWFHPRLTTGMVEIGTEDYPFCDKLAQYGVGVWVDGTLTSDHLTMTPIGEQQFLQANPKTEAELAAMGTVSMTAAER